jgi:hypothetical protein
MKAGRVHLPAPNGNKMDIYEIDPIEDARWERFVDGHPDASIFHTRGWLQALQRTYGYTPTAFTASHAGSDLVSGICFCRITGLFGRRKLVSLPFSDYCVPLMGDRRELDGYLQYLREKLALETWSYIEIRSSLSSGHDAWLSADRGAFVLHKLNLQSDLEDIAKGFHQSCILRKIKRAEREGVQYQAGTSEELLKQFYKLLVVTRRKHGLPPQPYEWFQNLIACLGQKILIHVAYKNLQPLAAIITVTHQRTVIYKYSCSDHRDSNLGGTQLLLWNVIRAAKAQGLTELDLGRSETSNQGLVNFKDRWGATKLNLLYRRYPGKPQAGMLMKSTEAFGRYICSHAPLGLLTAAGKAIYRFAG